MPHYSWASVLENLSIRVDPASKEHVLIVIYVSKCVVAWPELLMVAHRADAS